MDGGLPFLGVGVIYAVMALSLIAAVMVVTLRNLFHAALALAGVLLGTAALFVSLRTDFLAMVQILIYVGAVLTLIVFAIMLTTKLTDASVEQRNKQSNYALLFISFFSAVLIGIVIRTPWPVLPQGLNQSVSAADLGRALLGPYVFPFEVVSVILIAVLIGALTIAKKDS